MTANSTSGLEFFDFDDLDTWAPSLSQALVDIVPMAKIVRQKTAVPEYIEDARDLVIKHPAIDKTSLYGAVEAWLRSHPVRAYHGTRLFPDELQTIREHGLILTKREDRVERIRRVLSPHPDWANLQTTFDSVLHDFLVKHHQEVRVGQVHLTISRQGVVAGFNHYIEYGAEFDQRFIQMLLSEHNADIMKAGTSPYLLTFELPGEVAVDTLVAYASKFAAIRGGEPFDLVRKIIGHWAYKHFYPAFSSGKQQEDLGVVFYEAVNPKWLVAVEKIDL